MKRESPPETENLRGRFLLIGGERRADSLSWKNPSFDRIALMNDVSGVAAGRGGRNTPAEGFRQPIGVHKIWVWEKRAGGMSLFQEKRLHEDKKSVLY